MRTCVHSVFWYDKCQAADCNSLKKLTHLQRSARCNLSSWRRSEQCTPCNLPINRALVSDKVIYRFHVPVRFPCDAHGSACPTFRPCQGQTGTRHKEGRELEKPPLCRPIMTCPQVMESLLHMPHAVGMPARAVCLPLPPPLPQNVADCSVIIILSPVGVLQCLH